MKKVIVTLFVLGASACRTSTQSTTSMAPAPATAAAVRGGAQTGAGDALGAIRGFLAAAKMQDLQAMSAYWGTKDGSVRDQLDRTELEKRELIMACYLKHDKYEIVGDAPNPGGTRAAVVSVTYGDINRSTTFEVVEGPAQRWYVQSFEPKTLQDICSRRG